MYLYEREAAAPPFYYFTYMNEILKVVVKLKKLTQNIQLTFHQTRIERNGFGQFWITFVYELQHIK